MLQRKWLTLFQTLPEQVSHTNTDVEACQLVAVLLRCNELLDAG